MKHSFAFFRRKSLRTILIVASSMSLAFVLGIETAGDMQPVINETSAVNMVLDGDLNGSGILDVNDARIALELAQNYRTPTPHELAADPNQDFNFTVEDAISILEKLEHQALKPATQL